MFREGVIVINKSSGWTSQDVCAKLRGRLHIKKIGHTGTLDPMATGVLPVCIGKATRIIEYYDLDIKTYRATMKLGVRTDTFDITGNVIKEIKDISIDEGTIIQNIKSYIGKIEQTPPKYSAVKINGKRAYDLAREGTDFEIKPRTIDIYSIDNINIDMEQSLVNFDVSCSKGTYIRTLCDDIGNKLGCGATMTELVRLSNGCFKIEHSKTIDQIISMTDEEINEQIIPADLTLDKLGSIQVDENFVVPIRNGNDIFDKCCTITEETSFRDLYKIYANNVFLGIGKIIEKKLKMEKVISFGDI